MRSQEDILNDVRRNRFEERDTNILQTNNLISNTSANKQLGENNRPNQYDLQRSSIKIMINNNSDDADNTDNAVTTHGIASNQQLEWQCPKVFPADSATVSMPATVVLGSKYINLTKNLAENHRNEKNVENHSWFNNNHNANNISIQSMNAISTTYVNSNSGNNNPPELLLTKINNNILSQRNLEHYTKLLPTTSLAMAINHHNHNVNINDIDLSDNYLHQTIENNIKNNTGELSTNNTHKVSMEAIFNVCNEYTNGSQYQFQHYPQNQSLSLSTTTAATSNELTLSPIVQNRIKTNGSLSRERKSPFHHEVTNASIPMLNHQNISSQQQQDFFTPRESTCVAEKLQTDFKNSHLASFCQKVAGNNNADIVSNDTETQGIGATYRQSALNSKSSYEDIISGRSLMKSPRTKIRTTYMSPMGSPPKKDYASPISSVVSRKSIENDQQPNFNKNINKDNSENYERMDKLTISTNPKREQNNYKDINGNSNRNLRKSLSSSTIFNSHNNASLSSSLFELNKCCSQNTSFSMFDATESLFTAGVVKPTTDGSNNDLLQQISCLQEQIKRLKEEEKSILNEMKMELSLSTMKDITNPVVDESKLALEHELKKLQQKIHRLESQRNATRVMEENKQAKLKQSVEMKQDQLAKLTAMLKENMYNSCLQEEYHKLNESLENDSRMFEDLEFQYLEEESEWHGYREELNAELKALLLKIEEKRYEGEHQKLNKSINTIAALSNKSEMLNDQLLKVMKDLAICKEHLRILKIKLKEIPENIDHHNLNITNKDHKRRYSCESLTLDAAVHNGKNNDTDNCINSKINPSKNCIDYIEKKRNFTTATLSNSLELLICDQNKFNLNEINTLPINSCLMSRSVNENLIYNNNSIEREKRKDYPYTTSISHHVLDDVKQLNGFSNENHNDHNDSRDELTTSTAPTAHSLSDNTVKKNPSKDSKEEGEKHNSTDKKCENIGKEWKLDNTKIIENRSDRESSPQVNLVPKVQRRHTNCDVREMTGCSPTITGNYQNKLGNSNDLEERRRILPRHQRPLTRYLPIFSSTLDLRQHIESAGHQITLCPHVFLDSSSCRGYLHKLGATFHGWSKRWFVLDRQRGIFIYYTDKSERKPRGGAYFMTIQEVYLDHLNASKSGRPHCTFVVKCKERSYHLQAASAAAARIWIDVIITAAQANLDY